MFVPTMIMMIIVVVLMMVNGPDPSKVTQSLISLHRQSDLFIDIMIDPMIMMIILLIVLMKLDEVMMSVLIGGRMID